MPELRDWRESREKTKRARMTTENTLVVLFVIATAVALLAHRFRVPYTVALVLTGLGIGSLGLIEPPHLTKALLFAFILPGLLFEAAFHLDLAIVRRDWLTITALAVPGVIAAIGLTAFICTVSFRILGLDPEFSMMIGLVFGALISATDPIAVVALFRSMRTSPRLTTLIEGESLLNDGTSIVFLTLILGYVAGTGTTASSIALQLLLMVGGGVLVGAAAGLGVSTVMKRIDDPMIEITLTVIAAYGSFALAEQIHCSGVLATVVAGMVCGAYGKHTAMSPATATAVHAFWEYASFALNSLVFLLVGFTIPMRSVLASWPEISIAYLAAIGGRAGVIALVTLLFKRSRQRLPPRWPVVLTWGGIRGALSMVLALALSRDFPNRDMLEVMTLGVVFISLTLQGLSMRWVLRWAGIRRDQPADPAR
jgi:CPA1 family monovalent cation:H+ antiporter